MPILLKSYTTLNVMALLIASTYGAIQLRKSGVSWLKISALAICMSAMFLIGARVYYALLHLQLIFEAPERLFTLRLVNFGLYGGLMASLGTLGLWCYKQRRDVWGILDGGMPWMALALSFSKLGCFLNGCCYGVISDLPWAMYFQRAEGNLMGWLTPGLISGVLRGGNLVLRHPTQLYEIGVFLGSAILVWAFFAVLSARKYAFASVEGVKALSYLMLITLGRWWIYALRDYPKGSDLTQVMRGPVTYGMLLVLLLFTIHLRVSHGRSK